MESVRQTIYTLVDQYPQAVFFTGLGLILLGLIWLAFLFFSIIRKAIWPMLLVTLGTTILVGPWVLSYTGWLKDTRPRERIVGGETVLTVTGTEFDYAALKNRGDLDILQMANKDVTDRTLEYLSHCKNLHTLDLNNTGITDAGLRAVSMLPIRKLLLTNTAVTDQGVRQYLTPMDSLMELDLLGTKVSKEAGKEWKTAKPKRMLLQ